MFLLTINAFVHSYPYSLETMEKRYERYKKGIKLIESKKIKKYWY
jgi:hypothetical protein